MITLQFSLLFCYRFSCGSNMVPSLRICACYQIKHRKTEGKQRYSTFVFCNRYKRCIGAKQLARERQRNQHFFNMRHKKFGNYLKIAPKKYVLHIIFSCTPVLSSSRGFVKMYTGTSIAFCWSFMEFIKKLRIIDICSVEINASAFMIGSRISGVRFRFRTSFVHLLTYSPSVGILRGYCRLGYQIYHRNMKTI